MRLTTASHLVSSFQAVKLWIAKLFQLLNLLRSVMHSLAMSSRQHPSTRSCTILKLFCSSDPSAVSTVVDLVVCVVSIT